VRVRRGPATVSGPQPAPGVLARQAEQARKPGTAAVVLQRRSVVTPRKASRMPMPSGPDRPPADDRLAGEATMITETIAAIGPPDATALADARERQERLTKPSGSLGMLEDLSVRLAGLAGQCPPPLPQPVAIAVFAGDHGVHARGVTPWPQEVTAQMVANFLAGGAVVNSLAAQVGAEVYVVDVGVAADLQAVPGLISRKGGTSAEQRGNSAIPHLG